MSPGKAEEVPAPVEACVVLARRGADLCKAKSKVVPCLLCTALKCIESVLAQKAKYRLNGQLAVILLSCPAAVLQLMCARACTLSHHLSGSLPYERFVSYCCELLYDLLVSVPVVIHGARGALNWIDMAYAVHHLIFASATALKLVWSGQPGVADNFLSKVY